MSDVLIYSERESVALELLTPGSALARAGKGRVVVLKISGEDSRPDETFTRGADEVIRVRSSRPDSMGSDEVLAALHEAVVVENPGIVLLGATPVGNEVAARLAQRLGRGAATGCTELRLDAGGSLVVERRVFGGRFVAEQEFVLAPAIVTVQPRRYEAPSPTAGRIGQVTDLSVVVPEPRVRVVSTAVREQSPGDITSAEVIVAAGRGVGRQEDLALVESLARVLGGALAGSRPLTDQLKWLHPDRKVGLSGQTVRPKLYVACGISGQIEHVVGMRPSRTVVAINSDPNARIHGESDYSVVADLHKVIPALVSAIEAERSQSSTDS